MENKKRKQFRPTTIFFETAPLVIDDITLITKPDREYVNILDRSGVMYNCFEKIVYDRLEAGKRYKLSGMVNCTLGSKFLSVIAYEEVVDDTPAETGDEQEKPFTGS